MVNYIDFFQCIMVTNTKTENITLVVMLDLL